MWGLEEPGGGGRETSLLPGPTLGRGKSREMPPWRSSSLRPQFSLLPPTATVPQTHPSADEIVDLLSFSQKK